VSDPWSFDAETTAAAAVAGGPGGELPPGQQVTGRLWPYPGYLVSDHSSDASAKPATRAVPTDPPQGPLWAAGHDGVSLPAVRPENQAAPASAAHDGSQGKPRLELANIGAPFTLTVARFLRHLATDQWDSTGKRVSPPDAPSAPVQLYGSQHNTRPRLTESRIGPLFQWAWPAADQFSVNPGYLGVNAAMPDLSPRQQGAIAAQPADQPYVAAAPAAAAAGVSYDLEWAA
jgi:hypothetical protein